MAVPKLRFKEFNGEWIYFKFSDEIKLMGGATPSKSNKTYWNGDIVWLSSQEIKKKYVEEGTYKITQKAIDDNTTKMVTAGTPLIVSRSGILTRMFPISMPTIDVAINQDIKALIFDKARLDTDFLVGQLQSKESFILKSIVKTGTTVQSVNIPDLQKMKLSLPMNFEEQQKIGVFFKRIDEKIHLQQEKIDLLKKQKKGYMQKIFSQELRFKDENEQEFSKWKSILVKDVLSLNLREVPKPTTAYTRLGLRSHAKGTFHELVSDVDSVNMDTLYEVHNGDFIINITFAWEQALAIADKEDHGKLVSHRFPTYRFKENHEKNFYKHFFTTKYFKYCLGNASPGGAGRNRVLNKTDFMKIEITVPTLKEQIKIGNFLDTLQSKIILAEHTLQTLKDQKQAFMQQMFI